MTSTSTLPLSRDVSQPVRIVLVSADLPRVASYHTFLEGEGFEVLVAFDLNTALHICRRSSRPVKAAVVLTETGVASLPRDGEFVRNLADAAPTIPCILLPPGATAPDCAVLIRTAMRCTAAAYLGYS